MQNHSTIHGFSHSVYRYGFNGMEADDEIKGEGNSYNFGARMYDARLGRWFCTDSRETKYPFLTPYHFVNNNPILYIDYNGEDFVISINHESKTITISETYYVVGSANKTTISAMNAGTDFWNNQSGKFSYVLENSDGTLELYSINFELKTEVIEAAETDGRLSSDQIMETLSKSEIVTLPHEKVQKIGGGHSDRGDGTMGIGFGDKIVLSEKLVADLELIAHEMGHNLGLTHIGFLLMNPVLNDKVNLLPQNIEEILGRAGIGDSKELINERWLGGEMRSKEGEINTEGKVMPTFRAEYKAKKAEKKSDKKRSGDE